MSLSCKLFLQLHACCGEKTYDPPLEDGLEREDLTLKNRVILRPRKLQRNFGIFKQYTLFLLEAG